MSAAMASRRPMLRSVLPPLLVIVGVAVLCGLAYAPWYLNYDTRYALVWAHDLWHGFSPEYTAAFAPTPHPLWTAAASLALPFGEHADDAMAWLVLGSFGVVIWLTYRLGEELFGHWAGVVAALVVLTRPAMQRDVLLAYLDVPFAALIVGAALLEVRRPRRGLGVLVVLAIAGLLRPEAWALAGLYVLYLWRGLATRDRVRYSALALLAPMIWFGSDAIITGDALHSLHGTAALAEDADRRRSVGDIPYWTVQYFGSTLRVAVLAGIPLGLLFAYRRGLRRAHIPLVVAGLLIIGFAIGPFFGLPLIGRYVRTPAILLSLYYGAACFGWLGLAPSRARFRWGLAGLACIGLSVIYLPSIAGKLGDLRGRRDRDAAFYDALRTLARSGPVREAFRTCPRVSTADHRPVPYLRWWLRGPPGSVGTVEQDAGSLAGLYLTPRPTRIPRHFYGPNLPRRAPPAGYHEIYRNASWSMMAAPGC